MSQKCKLEPCVFLTVGDHGSVVVTPSESHTPKTWKETQRKIADTYISECIDGPYRSPGGRCEGVSKALEFFERHAKKWDCTYIKGNTICNWLLVE
ncbi:MAG: hypothetical protein V4664_01665 [Patescibacteria group bacterium]